MAKEELIKKYFPTLQDASGSLRSGGIFIRTYINEVEIAQGDYYALKDLIRERYAVAKKSIDEFYSKALEDLDNDRENPQ